jgi:hypothetical protein
LSLTFGGVLKRLENAEEVVDKVILTAVTTHLPSSLLVSAFIVRKRHFILNSKNSIVEQHAAARISSRNLGIRQQCKQRTGIRTEVSRRAQAGEVIETGRQIQH